MNRSVAGIDEKRRRLAVIGGGAKAVAIAAHIAALRMLNHPTVPELTVFEAEGIGSMWTNGGGYTDGNQVLCTPPERDLGFPYEQYDEATQAELGEKPFARGKHWDPTLEEELLTKLHANHALFPQLSDMVQEHFSFVAFLKSERAPWSFAAWVGRGRPNLTHADFQKYLKWAWNQALKKGSASLFNSVSGAAFPRPLERRRVKKISYVSGGWYIIDDKRVRSGPFDGVVLTGNGLPKPSLAAKGQTLSGARFPLLFDSKSFWNTKTAGKIDRALRLLRKDIRGPGLYNYPRIGIVGCGGTAAAIACRLLGQYPNAKIVMIGSAATLYARSFDGIELDFFHDIDSWHALSDKDRNETLARYRTGLLWPEIARRLSQSTRLEYICNRATEIEKYAKPLVEDVYLQVHCKDRATPVKGFDIVVEARGYDFIGRVASMLGGSERGSFMDEAEKLNEGHSQSVTRCFQVTAFAKKFPGLHLPDLCSIEDPAAPNLMAVGRVAKSIIRNYL